MAVAAVPGTLNTSAATIPLQTRESFDPYRQGYGTPGPVGPPLAPTAPIGQIPQIAPYNQPAVPIVNAPTPQTFTGTAPNPITTGAFTAPDPATFQTDPSYQFRLKQGEDVLQGSAAARGTLLTGGTAKAIQDYGQGAASQEYQNAYNRALGTYTTNRDTNAQNFGEAFQRYTGDLSKFTANTSAGLGYGSLTASDAAGNFARQDQAAREEQEYQQRIADANAARTNVTLQSNFDQQQAQYARQVAATAQQNATLEQDRQRREREAIARFSYGGGSGGSLRLG